MGDRPPVAVELIRRLRVFARDFFGSVHDAGGDLSVTNPWLSRTSDTAGEFAPGGVWPELGLNGASWEGKSAVPEASDEFASSIRCYSRPMVRSSPRTRARETCRLGQGAA